jgi:hypothetical protein
MRALTYLLSLAALPLTACPAGAPAPEDGGVSDLRRRVDMARDLAEPPPDLAPPPGRIGAACTTSRDCHEGVAPVCWERKLLNDDDLLDAPGGYCSSRCRDDSECGGKNRCVDFGPYGRFCLAGCADANTCRHDDYSCLYYDVSGDMINGVCLPNADLLDCNPKEVRCTDRITGTAGGCVRQAFEDKRGGLCNALCEPGEGCATDIFGTERNCLFLDFTPGGDAFRGTLCFPMVGRPKDEGQMCRLANECVKGYQCDNAMGGSYTCRRLCRLGRPTPACPTGTMCADAFGTGMGAGICR